MAELFDASEIELNDLRSLQSWLSVEDEVTSLLEPAIRPKNIYLPEAGVGARSSWIEGLASKDELPDVLCVKMEDGRQVIAENTFIVKSGMGSATGVASVVNLPSRLANP